MTAIQHVDQLLELHDIAFVEAAYQTLLGRAADQEGLRYYVQLLRTGHGKAYVIEQQMNSSEAKAHSANISGIDELLRVVRENRKWPWSKWMGTNQIGRQVHRLENELGRMMQNVERLQVEVNARMDKSIVDRNHQSQQSINSQIKKPMDARYIEAVKPIANLYKRTKKPIFSVIILQFNKSELTINCVRSLLRYTDLQKVELIVVDNGSKPEHVETLKKEFKDSISVIEIGINRYFGEGNNIGVDHANGEFIVFMNNDIVVTDGWLDDLKLNLKSKLDIVGPAFLYPDGRVQECGAYIRENGTSIQQFKGGNVADLPRKCFECDYISAALILMSKETFLKVGGFDLCYEPAYYEDVDLCLKVASFGGKVICAPNVRIYHNENATSSDPALGLNLTNDIVETNKTKFLDRWGSFILDRINNPVENQNVIGSAGAPLHARHPNHSKVKKQKALLFSPYPLTPGGGEKYLLTIAQELSKNYHTTLSFPYPYSKVRMKQLEAYLNLNLCDIELLDFSEAKDQIWDVSFILGNSIAPPFSKLAPTSFYICQFPFDKDLYSDKTVPFSSEYQYICYSDFVKDHISKNECIQPSNITVFPPAIQPYQSLSAKENVIISVGRFFTGGHCKNQHLLIEAFRSLVSNKLFEGWKLILIGSTRPEYEHRMYFRQCIDAAKGLNVEIIPDASYEVLSLAYAKASLYWHGSGLSVNPLTHPEQLEHFGITPLEAASAGCKVFVPDRGGPSAVAKAAPGRFYEYSSIEDLVSKTIKLSTTGLLHSDGLGAEVHNFVESFSISAFSENLLAQVKGELQSNTYSAPSHISFDDRRVRWVGWAEPEHHFRWSDKHESRIDFLWGDATNKKSKVCINFNTLGPQKISIQLNGVLLFEGKIAGDNQTLTFEEFSLIDGLNSLVFLLSTAHQPGNGDSRLLALAFKSLTFSKKNSPH